uniref:Transmembrane protein 241 n=1 Tax=Strix occidentalis caurina TaxID=311401 RepID=A0A8D0KZG4_STROC
MQGYLTVKMFSLEVLFCFYFRWQTLVGGLLLHVSWKLGWVEINLCSRSEILSWLPASVLFVGIIYAGSRALSRLPIPVFLTVHNAAEVITCGFQKFVQKEVIDLLINTFKHSRQGECKHRCCWEASGE